MVWKFLYGFDEQTQNCLTNLRFDENNERIEEIRNDVIKALNNTSDQLNALSNKIDITRTDEMTLSFFKRKCILLLEYLSNLCQFQAYKSEQKHQILVRLNNLKCMLDSQCYIWRRLLSFSAAFKRACNANLPAQNFQPELFQIQKFNEQLSQVNSTPQNIETRSDECNKKSDPPLAPNLVDFDSDDDDSFIDSPKKQSSSIKKKSSPKKDSLKKKQLSSKTQGKSGGKPNISEFDNSSDIDSNTQFDEDKNYSASDEEIDDSDGYDSKDDKFEKDQVKIKKSKLNAAETSEGKIFKPSKSKYVPYNESNKRTLRDKKMQEENKAQKLQTQKSIVDEMIEMDSGKPITMGMTVENNAGFFERNLSRRVMSRNETKRSKDRRLALMLNDEEDEEYSKALSNNASNSSKKQRTKQIKRKASRQLFRKKCSKRRR